jgi:hypothetical protein
VGAGLEHDVVVLLQGLIHNGGQIVKIAERRRTAQQLVQVTLSVVEYKTTYYAPTSQGD